jgi:hypothetical protein
VLQIGIQRNALEVIVKHEVHAFARHEFFNSLIDEKWKNFARWMYLSRTVIPYVVLLTTVTAYIMIRADEIHFDLTAGGGGHGNNTGKMLYCVQHAASWAWNGGIDPDFDSTRSGYAAEKRISAFVLQLGFIVIGCPFLLYKGWQSRRLKLRDLDTDENGNVSHAEILSFIFKNASFLLNLGAVVALFIGFVARLQCKDMRELEAEAVASVLLFDGLLIVLMPFRFIGELVITVYRMFVGDVFRFLVVFIVLQVGFALSLLLLTRSAVDPSLYHSNNLADAFLHLLWLSLGDNLSDNVSNLAGLESELLIMAVYIIWIVFSTVLMLNLLISMMSRTFNQDAEDIHRVWIFPFAALVLRIEKRHLFPGCSRRCGNIKSTTIPQQESPHIKQLRRERTSKMLIT